MALTRKAPSEMSELNQQEQGEPEGRNRFESARFKVRLPAKESPAETTEDDDSEPQD